MTGTHTDMLVRALQADEDPAAEVLRTATTPAELAAVFDTHCDHMETEARERMVKVYLDVMTKKGWGIGG